MATPDMPSLQPLWERAIDTGDYELASELADQEAASQAHAANRERLHRNLAIYTDPRQLLSGDPIPPRDMEGVDQPSLPCAE